MLTKALQLASQITHPITAAVFAAVLALIALVTLSRGKRKPPKIAWLLALVIFLLGLSPLLASTYLESRGIYRVRIEVLDADKQPIRDAEVTSSAGGELEKTDAGWESTIPREETPVDGKVTFRADKKDAFLAGSAVLTLGKAYFPEVEIQLLPLPQGTVRGTVEDPNGSPVEGARVWIEGYDDVFTTGPTGSFFLAAHAANGQPVTIMATKAEITARTTALVGAPAEVILRKHQ